MKAISLYLTNKVLRSESFVLFLIYFFFDSGTNSINLLMCLVVAMYFLSCTFHVIAGNYFC